MLHAMVATRARAPGGRGPVCRRRDRAAAGRVEAKWKNGGVPQSPEAVRTAAIEALTVFRDFDNYWQPLALGTGPAPRLLREAAGRGAQSPSAPGWVPTCRATRAVPSPSRRALGLCGGKEGRCAAEPHGRSTRWFTMGRVPRNSLDELKG